MRWLGRPSVATEGVVTNSGTKSSSFGPSILSSVRVVSLVISSSITTTTGVTKVLSVLPLVLSEVI